MDTHHGAIGCSFFTKNVNGVRNFLGVEGKMHERGHRKGHGSCMVGCRAGYSRLEGGRKAHGVKVLDGCHAACCLAGEVVEVVPAEGGGAPMQGMLDVQFALCTM